MEGEDNLAIERLRGSLNSDTLGAIETEGRFAAVDYGNREYRIQNIQKEAITSTRAQLATNGQGIRDLGAVLTLASGRATTARLELGSEVDTFVGPFTTGSAVNGTAKPSSGTCSHLELCCSPGMERARAIHSVKLGLGVESLLLAGLNSSLA